MSTKTTFKRIALVAVAALGLGVLSVAPSQAALSAISISGVTDGTSTNSADGYVSDSTTAGTFTVSGLTDTGSETITVTLVAKSAKAAAATNAFLYYVDSATSGSTAVDSITETLTTAAGTSVARAVGSATDTSTGVVPSSGFRLTRGASAGYMGAKFAIQLDSYSARAAGTYTWTIIAKGYKDAAGNVTSTTADVSVVVPDAASASTTVAPASSTAFIGTSAGAATSDAVISSVATASSTPVAYVRVRTYNANGNATPESVTATITGAGLLSFGGISGASLTIAADGDDDISVLANGTAGVATINISTTSATFAPKTVTFYAKAAKTLTAAVYNPVLQVGSNSQAVAVTAVDANGTNWAGAAYIVASSATDALVGGSATTPVACSYNSTYKTHFCPVSTKATGTAKFKVIDASTVAAATATSNEVTVTVSNSAPTSVKLAFDKATYAPYEKAYITVTVLGADGKPLQGQTYANLFATGGISSTQGFGSGSDTLTAVSVATDAASSATTPTTAGAKTYTVYMPAQGTVKITATGGTSLAASGQVEVSASADIVNSSVDAATDAANEATDAANAATDAALAAADAADAATAAAQDASDAVAALSASVSKLISQLRAQITSLTNLVIKIQKKVKA